MLAVVHATGERSSNAVLGTIRKISDPLHCHSDPIEAILLTRNCAASQLVCVLKAIFKITWCGALKAVAAKQ
jgi:hypothetical protein